MQETQAIIVGAGPIGLELAVALKEAGVDYLQFDAKQVGHTISWFPRQVRFFSSPERIAICGVPLKTADQSKATREEYLAYLSGIVEQFALQVNRYERVVSVEPAEKGRSGPFVVRTRRADGEHEYRADHVVLAVGDMHRPRKLRHPTLPEVPGAQLPHVHYYFDEPHAYVGQQLLIVGGRNSAVEAAIRCHRAGAQVALSYRRGTLYDGIKYWLKPEFEWLIDKGDIAFHAQTIPVAITPTTVTLAEANDDGQPAQDPSRQQTVAADFVLCMIGYEMDTSLLEMAGAQLDGPNQAPQLDPDSMETTVRGLYVAGTMAAGTQLHFKLFIENCHAHVVRILRAIADVDPQHISPLAFSRLHEHPKAAES